MSKHDQSIVSSFKLSYLDIAKAMEPGEIPEDIKTLLDQISELCRT